MRYDTKIMRATQAHIHLGNLRHNIEQVRTFLRPEVKLCIPVKADGYGHGATRVSIAAIKSGASFLAVASVQEGIELREAGIVAPVLSLSLPTPDEIPALVVHSVTPLVFDEEFICSLGKAAENMNRTIPVHLKIDTGMGRIGCSVRDAAKLASVIAGRKGLFLEGVCTHFAVSDSPGAEDREYTRQQIALFSKAVDSIRKKGIDPGIVHCANSGAVLMYPECHFDMVRPGILVYGYLPDSRLAELMRSGTERAIDLRPVMELKTQVVTVKQVPAGSFISYGRDWQADEDTWIATIPIGYADGLPRRLSPGLRVLIGGKTYPVVGRICMDQCMVNLGKKHNVKRWDPVTVFGPDARGFSAGDTAVLAGTIPYEITCGINKRVPRVYTD